MYRQLRLGAMALGTAVLLSVSYAGASTITQYTGTASANVSAWESSVNGTGTDLPFSTVQNGSLASVSLGGFTFAGTSMTEYNNVFIARSIGVTMPSGGETGLLIDVASISGQTNATSFTLTLSDHETFTSLALGWYGIATASPITSLTISGPGTETTGLADLEYAAGTTQDTPTPEAATVLLTCGGLLVLFGCGRKLVFKSAF